MKMDRKKILFLQKRLLFPADTGGKIRTLNVLRHLAQWHDITYVSNLLPCEEAYLGEMQSLGLELVNIPWLEAPRSSPLFYGQLAANLFSRFPFNVNKDYDPELRRKVLGLVRDREYDLLICDFVQMARNCLGVDSVPKLLFQHNVESQIFQRHVQQSESLARKAYMYLQWKKMHRFERDAGNDFDAVVAVSSQDHATFEQEYGWQHCRTIGTAVDTEYFQPSEEQGISKRCVFVGSMDWLPNEQGVLRFVREIWPLVRQQVQTATFQIVGRNPTRAVSRLHGNDGITVTGTVSDVRPYIAGAQVTVVPLWVGGGTRLKVFEAMAMSKPVVSTSLGVEGLDLQAGDQLKVADAPEAFAAELVGLILDQAACKRIAESARQHVIKNYSSGKIAKDFDVICRETIGKSIGSSDLQYEGGA